MLGCHPMTSRPNHFVWWNGFGSKRRFALNLVNCQWPKTWRCVSGLSLLFSLACCQHNPFTAVDSKESPHRLVTGELSKIRSSQAARWEYLRRPQSFCAMRFLPDVQTNSSRCFINLLSAITHENEFGQATIRQCSSALITWVCVVVVVVVQTIHTQNFSLQYVHWADGGRILAWELHMYFMFSGTAAAPKP